MAAVSLRAVALVVAGGTVGTLARAGLAEAIGTEAGHWPWATFTANVAGSFLLGVLVAVVARRGGSDRWRQLLGTGVLGGFTTYSTFAVEVDRLIGGGHVALGAGYAFVSLVLGIGAAAVGVVLGRARR